jgi:hypothetical protein
VPEVSSGYDELQQDRTRLEATLDAVRARLASLDQGARRLKSATGLTGTTKERAGQALEALSWIRDQTPAIERLLKEAKAVPRHSRGPGYPIPTQELRRLLHEPSIQPKPRTALLARADTLSRVELPDWMTPDRLLAEMTAASELVGADIERIEKRWTEDLPQFRQVLKGLNVDVPTDPDDPDSRLERARDHSDLVDRLESDPLSVEDDDLDVAKVEVDSLRFIDKPLHDPAALEAELRTAEPRLHKLEHLIQQGETASAKARRTIARPEGLVELIDEHCLQDQDHGPIPWLARIRKASGTGQARAAAAELMLWQKAIGAWIEDATRIAKANLAPLRERQELRQRLQKLRGKAEQRGVAADEALVGSHAQAEACLVAEPTDLSEARARVMEYGALVALRI